jgi:hypothetical protein
VNIGWIMTRCEAGETFVNIGWIMTGFVAVCATGLLLGWMLDRTGQARLRSQRAPRRAGSGATGPDSLPPSLDPSHG